MKYFRLNTDVYRVSGKNGSVLYDIMGSTIYVLDSEAERVLSHCESNGCLDDSTVLHSRLGILDALADRGLGQYYSKPVYIDPMLLKHPDSRVYTLPPPYNKLSLAITDACEHECEYCPYLFERDLSWFACNSCVRSYSKKNDANYRCQAESLLADAYGLGVTWLHIRGGNPFLNWEYLQKVLACAASYEGLRVCITTPGTGRPISDIISLYERDGVCLNVTVSGAAFSDAHKEKDQSLFKAQCKLLNSLSERNLDFSITANMVGCEASTSEVISKVISERFGKIPYLAQFIRRSDFSLGECKFHVVKNGKRSLAIWSNPVLFYHRLKNNYCLYGSMEVDTYGDIKVCAGCSQCYGSVREKSLLEFAKDNELHDTWKRTKAVVSPCNDCALRFACSDCHAAEQMAPDVPGGATCYCPLASVDSLYDSANLLNYHPSVFFCSAKGDVTPCPK